MGNYSPEEKAAGRCPGCGVMRKRGQAFCPNCGQRFVEIPDQQPKYSPPRPTPPPSADPPRDERPKVPVYLIVLLVASFLVAIALIGVLVFLNKGKTPEAQTTSPVVSATTATQPATTATQPATAATQPATAATQPATTATQPAAAATQPAMAAECQHVWLPITCTQAKTCSLCGKTEGVPAAHSYMPATCTKPAICRICGTTEGVPSGEHTYVKTGVSQIPVCSGCQHAKAVFLPELQYTYKWGKLWLRTEVAPGGSYDTKASAPGCWMNEDILGCTVGPVRDNKGNTFTWGMHLDGGNNDNPGSAHSCSIKYQLDGRYTSFTGFCSYPADVISTEWAPSYYKNLTIQCDGRHVFTSSSIGQKSGCQTIPPIDVTGVQELTISWPIAEGPNEVCTLYDAKLS